MRNLAIILLALAAGACGGGGSKPATVGNGPAAADPMPVTSRTVSYATNPSGCIGRHNADSEVAYLLGDQQAKYLVWHCANHDQHELRRVRLSLLFDYQQQCYVQNTTVVDFAHCSGPLPKAPGTPTFGLRIADFAVTPGRNAQGQPGFSYYAVIDNFGNVPAFDVTVRVAIDQDGGGNTDNIRVIEPGASVTTRRYEVYGAAPSGTRFSLDLFVEDAAGRTVATRGAVVDIP